MTTTVLDTKTGEVVREIPNVSGLVTTAAFNTKIVEVESTRCSCFSQENRL